MNLLWLQSGGCGGCTLSLLGAEGPDLLETLAGVGIRILWHPSLSEASGRDVLDLLERVAAGEVPLDLLCIEGALLRGPNGTGAFHRVAGTQTPMIEWVRRLAARARHCLAIGTCAAFGGVTAGGPNPTDACGLQFEGQCGLARPRILAGGTPVRVIASHEPGIEPCGAAGNRRVDA